jgi:hypothetical protein
MHGGMCTGPKTEAGRAKVSRALRDALLRSWAKWDPKARIKYARALYQGQGDRMRRIRRAELARQARESVDGSEARQGGE